MKDKILVTARSFRKTPGPHQTMLTDAGYEVAYNPHDRPLEASELAELGRDVVGMLLGVDSVTAEVFEQAKRLKVISRYGVGLDTVDLKAATAHGVVVTITPGANSVTVAELTIGLMFALARRIAHHDRIVKGGKWSRVSGIELTGLTLGLLGLGRIGQEVARRAAGLGMKVIFYDPMPPPQNVASELRVEYHPLDEVIAGSDVLSLHVPLNETTRNLIDGARLAQMKPAALLINTARGGLVDEQALYEALAEGRLAGAACDVFATEPPAENPLLGLDQFIATPHLGSDTVQTVLRMGTMAAENLLAVLRGERPASVANPEVYDRL
jgi:D-3-phosphoglycerate dehydrogenase